MSGSREELVGFLLSWRYEPRYRTTGLADDWEFRDNSFEVVEYAFVNDFIDETDYERIVRALDEDDPATKDSGGSGRLRLEVRDLPHTS